jgi:ATP-binding cassette subfamily B protein
MIRGYLTILGDERRRLYVVLAWAVAYGVAQGVSMLLLVPITRALFDGDVHTAGGWLLLLIPVVALCCVTFYLQSLSAMQMAVHTMRALHHRLGDHLVTLPLGWFTRDKTASVSQIAVKGTMFVGSAGAHLMTPIITNLAGSATVVVGLFFFDWRIGLTAAIGAMVLWGVGMRASALIADAESHNHDTAVTVNGRVLEVARHQPTLRAFGSAGADYRPLEDALEQQHSIGRSMMGRSVTGLLINGLAVQAVFTAILVVGAALAVSGDIEAAVVMAVFGLAARFTDPISELAELGSAMRMSTAEIDRITDILHTPAMPRPASPVAPTERGSIELVDVSFSYDSDPDDGDPDDGDPDDGDPDVTAGTGSPPSRVVLRDIGFSVPNGSMTALVGPSGSGKTTATRLIARFYDATAGTVRVGGVDVRDQDTATLMAQLSLVFQDVYLFDDTLRENIRIGRLDATDDDICRAAATAGVDSIVERLPGGWETRVGEGGSALSGGERQRVSIARALVKNAPIVLFDEATSALDPENEAHVAASIRELARDSTVLVIAHKISTVLAADQIVVLTSDGRLADIGRHDELLARGGTYADFWRQRNAAAGWTMGVAQPAGTAG